MRKDPESCNCLALRQAARLVTKVYDAALASVDLGANQYSILSRLQRGGPSTLGDLAEELVMDRSTLGHLVRPLEKRGLIRLAVGEHDRRARLLTLTRAGESLVQKARPLWSSAQRKFEGAFGADSAARLRGLLNDVVTSNLA
ncbi:MAG TPA: MarR family winged helix-turn-helix transcriptional regulator [Candidatus Acidoferrales bacterium]|nr:MarR family winged helix-turn-helix transcriptional regulator [Candidatus Acidoferrales bacterium]